MLTILVAVRAPKEAKAAADEREKLIGLKASPIAFFTLSALALTGRGFPARRGFGEKRVAAKGGDRRWRERGGDGGIRTRHPERFQFPTFFAT
ncbi:MAG TPA: hypothetical protein VFW19_08005 [Allosphingosinicella sp.]|nr:hypothetical protein [Allosphingosinicella sp.]